MAYEIDFLPVGEGERSGDAIALRFGNLRSPREQTVVVIDGGSRESGKAMVEHIKRYYNTTSVDLVICTHSDSDHASGLVDVLESLSVGQLWMHLPWKHATAIDDLFRDPRVTADSLKRALRDSLEAARGLETLARKKGISIIEPFWDSVNPNGWLYVLSPTTGFYESLLPYFRGAPEAREEPGRFQRVADSTKEVITRMAESWGLETLGEPEDDATSAENNSSVVLLVKHDQRQFLFTSDAGVPALAEAANYAAVLGIDLRKTGFIQVPHHGSKRNVGPSVLDRVAGPKRRESASDKTALVSVSKGSEPKHPSKKVVNAFMRRGARVYATQGIPQRHYSLDAPDRGWPNATPLPFYTEVED